MWSFLMPGLGQVIIHRVPAALFIIISFIVIAQQSKIVPAFHDFFKFLTTLYSRPDWDEIDQMEPDDIPLSEEEEWQLKNNTEFVSWEDAMHELDLPTDIKP